MLGATVFVRILVIQRTGRSNAAWKRRSSDLRTLKCRYLGLLNLRNAPKSAIFKIALKERAMKDAIHPTYKRAVVTCVCGNTFETRSTLGNLHVEICSACHPYYTGKQKLLDSAGRVERFNKKYAKKKQEAPAEPAAPAPTA